MAAGAHAVRRAYYLHSGGAANSRFGDGTLSPTPPDATSRTDSYRYDPARPVPFITEPTSSQIGGPDDYAAIERRDDVLVYITEPLAEDTEVTGPDHRVDLYAASSAPDTDFMAKLLDVCAQRLRAAPLRRHGARALPRGDGPRRRSSSRAKSTSTRIDCWHTAQVFHAGHRIGLQIASSAFPKFDRNLNTGAPLGQTSEMAIAEQTIYHDAAHPSR